MGQIRKYKLVCMVVLERERKKIITFSEEHDITAVSQF